MAAARATAAPAGDGGPLLAVVHEDADLLVVDKPAGLVCHPSKAGPRSSLIGRVRLHLGDGATAHLINRLDRETSGLVLVAKTDPVARELRRLWETRQVEKEYVALVHGHVADDAGCIEAPLGKDTGSRVVIKDCVRPDGAAARTDYTVLQRQHLATADGRELPVTLLQVMPRTGRKHQIRIHLAHLGHPIVGDKLYGGCEDDYLALVEDRLTPEIVSRLVLRHHALHARAVRFTWRGGLRAFTCALPAWCPHDHAQDAGVASATAGAVPGRTSRHPASP
ncbi:MAG: RluA family pseudouridine synthase [Chromatiales bacterium]|jgi:23S rRNA pseudouridine1911/1915/1917 synthase|nr:RluA family pseudouridine synthase [Chromatiales bacterium]